ncbi:MAG: toxic anion resistance protein [Chloroflexi bacterium]|nr:toxic anion resistance protein [Chloroflexota bacterium]
MPNEEPFEAHLEPLSDNEQTAIIPLEALPPAKQQQVRELMTKIDIQDTQSIIAFGVEAQRELTASADQMIQRVRNKDVGPVGDTLSDLMLQVRGLGVDELRPGEKPNWFKSVILRRVHPIAKFVQRYESVQDQIDSLVVVLESHKAQLLRDVGMLDKLYDATVDYFHQLELYIAAASAKLREMDEQVLPALRARAEETRDMLDAQNLRDATSRRDDLERRLHDLRLTRQVTLQSLPQIRLIQDVDKSLVTKIQSSVLTTIPVWKSQIALAITLWNQRKALETQRAVTDTTNEMLARNAELLRMGSAEARKEIERGIFDIETVKKVNDELIATIHESIQIAEEGHRKRLEAETQMEQLEGDLKQALINAEDMRGQLRSGRR